MRTILPLPNGLKFTAWAAYFVEAQSALCVPEPPADEADWGVWGQQLLQFPQLAILPDTAGFAGWEAWAARVVELLSGEQNVV